MSRRFLLPLLLAAVLCMGSVCSGGGSSSNVQGPAASTAAAQTAAEAGGDTRQPGAPVPEPSAALVFGLGLLVAGAVRRRRR